MDRRETELASTPSPSAETRLQPASATDDSDTIASPSLMVTKVTALVTTSTILPSNRPVSQLLGQMTPLLIYSLLIFLPSGVQSKGVLEFHISKVNESFFDTLSSIPKQCCLKSSSTTPVSINSTDSICAWNSCLVRLQFCLTMTYEKDKTTQPFCAYDKQLTKPHLIKDLQSKGDLNFQLKVNARWQQQFALIFDILAVSSENDTTGALVLRRVVRSTKPLPPSKHWYTFPRLPPIQYSYRFICAEHFYGTDCAKKCQARDGIHGHYNCSKEGEVVCHPGWSGSFCTVPECKGGCGVHGRCDKPNGCTCDPGWSGSHCEHCTPHPGCQNGSCALREGVHVPFTCRCHQGWGGMFCNIDLNFCTNHPNPCKNGGKCLNKRSDDTNLQYTCRCPPAFRGTHCEQLVADCRLNNCSDRGECLEKIPGRETRWQCHCRKPFYGDRCQFNQTTCADNPCQAHGAVCEDDSHMGFRCRCPRGFTGRNCEINIDDCKDNPCKNDGKCVDDIAGYKCVCPVGFFGAHCNIDNNECEKVSCLNEGRCVDMANSVECRCKPGFFGSVCQFEINECRAKPCQNGAPCEDRVNDYICHCPTNYTGKNCHISIKDPCSAKPCVRGKCRSLVINGVFTTSLPFNASMMPFVCDCPKNFRGRLCEFQVPNGTAGLNMHPDPFPTIDPDQQSNEFQFSPLEIGLIVSIGISLPMVTILFGILLCVCRRRNHKKRYGAKELGGMLRQSAVHDHMVHNQLNSLRSIRNDLSVNRAHNCYREPLSNGHAVGASGGGACVGAGAPQPLLAVRKVHNTDKLINYKHIPPPPTVALPVAAKLAHLEGIDNCSLTGDDGLASSSNSSMIEKAKEYEKCGLPPPPQPPTPPTPPPPPPPPPPYRYRKSPDGSERNAYKENSFQGHSCEQEPLRRSSTTSLRGHESIYSVDIRDAPVQCVQPGFLQDLLSSQANANTAAASVDLGQAGVWHDFQVTEV